MANETTKATNGDAKETKRKRTAVKSEWTGTKLQTRTVDAEVGPKGNKKKIRYIEVRFSDEVKEIAEAVTLLKLKKREPIIALAAGANARARKNAAGQSSIIQRVADHKGITFDEARAMLNM